MPPDATNGGRRRVVVIGGGFGGLAAARSLRHADVDVTLVDRNNHHLFQPLLYQAAAGALSPSDCASPIRPYLKHSNNTTVLMAEVTEVDPERRQVVLDRGDRLDYDSLIVACGGETSYFGKDEWRQVTCGLKTLARRDGPEESLLRRPRTGRAHGRSGRAVRVDDVRRRRRRSHRCRDRRPARDHGPRRETRASGESTPRPPG